MYLNDPGRHSGLALPRRRRPHRVRRHGARRRRLRRRRRHRPGRGWCLLGRVLQEHDSRRRRHRNVRRRAGGGLGVQCRDRNRRRGRRHGRRSRPRRRHGERRARPPPQPRGSPAWLGFAASTPLGSTVTTKALALGDLNRDGKLDLVAGNGTQTNTFRLGTGTGLGAARTIGAITLDIDAGRPQRLGPGRVAHDPRADDRGRLRVHAADARGRLADRRTRRRRGAQPRRRPDHGAGRRQRCASPTGASARCSSLGATLVVGPVRPRGDDPAPAEHVAERGHDRQRPAARRAVRPDRGDRLRPPARRPPRRWQRANAVSIEGNFLFEQTTNSLGQRRVVVAGRRLASFGGTEVFRNGGGILVVLPGSGLAGQLSGEIVTSAFLPSNVEFVGTLAFAMNASTSAVTETVTLGGDTCRPRPPAGAVPPDLGARRPAARPRPDTVG